MVIATQNPIEQAGTYRLPEAQLDRFLMKTSLGYPDHDSTVALLADAATKNRSGAGAAADHVERQWSTWPSSPAKCTSIRRCCRTSAGSPTRRAVLRRPSSGSAFGAASTTSAAAKTWAASNGRNYVVPDDIKELAEPILSHRLALTPEAEFSGTTVPDVLSRILADVQPPETRAA